MKLTTYLTFVLITLLVGLSFPALAMDRRQEREFDRVSAMPMDELTESAGAALQKRYPDEKWQSHRFPDYVFTNESTEAAYKIAVKRPELLAKIPCYCSCEQIGHKNLLYCFFDNGAPGVFNRHASFCTICYGEAMRAFLWAELGATDQEILEGMKKKYMPERTVPEELLQP
ncbi:MAG: hypothetical protein HYV06_02485 [Deltaproteobacteria bacterium]|nr:hypothetical protein [Deltaproteobacteria bacterium]